MINKLRVPNLFDLTLAEKKPCLSNHLNKCKSENLRQQVHATSCYLIIHHSSISSQTVCLALNTCWRGPTRAPQRHLSKDQNYSKQML